jgi:hypothetical protein
MCNFNKLFDHLRSLVDFLPKSSDNNLPICSSIFDSLYSSTPIRIKKENDNNNNNNNECNHQN